MRKVKKSALLLSLAVIMSLLMSMPVFAHGAFITMDSETTVGQEVTATVMFGHFPNADGSILAGDELSWRFYLIHPDGTEENLSAKSRTDGANQWLSASFVPQSGGFYQVVFYRDRGVRNSTAPEGRVHMQQMASAHIFVNGGAYEGSFDRVTKDGQLEIKANSDVTRMSPGSVFSGQLLYKGKPLANATVIVEDANEKQFEFKTNSQGQISIRFPSAGTFLLSAQHIVEAPGTVNGEEIIATRNDRVLMLTIS